MRIVSLVAENESLNTAVLQIIHELLKLGHVNGSTLARQGFCNLVQRNLFL